MAYGIKEDADHLKQRNFSGYMKLVLMQPYFFPYIGYFTLIKYADVFVVFDTAQYIRRGWINRNRILGPCGEPVYINVSTIKSPQNTMIKSIKLSESAEWKQTILKNLEVYKKIAPYYDEVLNLLSNCLDYTTDSLAEFNTNALIQVCEFLGIDHNIKWLSDLNIEFKEIQKPDDWGLQLSEFYGANMYINAPGGQGIYSKEKYSQHGIELAFYTSQLLPYDQKQGSFHKGLSILDVLMFNSKNDVNKMIDAYEIL